jgi:hypothetical protein
MKMLVIRDVNGKVINIGEWDYLKEDNIKDDGSIETVIHNPMPEGATSQEEDIVTLPDGGLSAAK